MVYATPKYTSRQIPENSPSDNAFISYQGGKQVSSYSNGDITRFAQ